jgi:hypothetical protein
MGHNKYKQRRIHRIYTPQISKCNIKASPPAHERAAAVDHATCSVITTYLASLQYTKMTTSRNDVRRRCHFIGWRHFVLMLLIERVHCIRMTTS